MGSRLLFNYFFKDRGRRMEGVGARRGPRSVVDWKILRESKEHGNRSGTWRKERDGRAVHKAGSVRDSFLRGRNTTPSLNAKGREPEEMEMANEKHEKGMVLIFCFWFTWLAVSEWWYCDLGRLLQVIPIYYNLIFIFRGKLKDFPVNAYRHKTYRQAICTYMSSKFIVVQSTGADLHGSEP